MPIGEPTMPTGGEKKPDEIVSQEIVSQETGDGDVENIESSELEEALEETDRLLAEAESVNSEVAQVKSQLEEQMTTEEDRELLRSLHDKYQEKRGEIDMKMAKLSGIGGAMLIGSGLTGILTKAIIDQPEYFSGSIIDIASQGGMVMGAAVMLAAMVKNMVELRRLHKEM